MARNPKSNANLKPIQKGELSSDEAKRRGSAGGKKSGEVRRAKRDARQSARYILGLTAKGEILEQLKKLGADPEDGLTNMDLLSARLFVQGTSNNLDAARMLLQMAGYDPEENRKERESINADKRRDIDTQFKLDTMAARGLDSANVSVNLENEDGQTDVMIYLPKVKNEGDLEIEDDDEVEEEKQKDGEGGE